MRHILVAVFFIPQFLTCFAQQEKGLKDYYKDYFTIGVAVSPRALHTDESGLILQQFNSLTAENAMKMGPIHPRENEYAWRDGDSIAAYAKRNNLKLRGHTLCWHNQVGRWFFVDSAGKNVSREVLLQRLKDHINTVVNRYKGTIYAWDVVNEAISDKQDEFLRPSLWLQIIGEDYVAKAFEFAHEADPNALLFYNDYNEINPVKRDKIYRLVKDLKAKGIPIHGVGLQGHWSIYEPSEKTLTETLEKFKDLGVTVHVTELDISVYPKEHSRRDRKPEDANDRLTEEQEKKQSEMYEMIFRVFRKYRGIISGVTFWNISDRSSWLDNFPVTGRKDYPLLFDKDLKPKQSFWKVVNFSHDYSSFPMWNPKLPIEQRVNDVVSRLTLDEKVKQMLNAAPAIPRLGILAYDWWNEVLHGVARTPFRATSYPQAIGMAATWDTNSLKKMADYSATEGRAIHNKAIETGRTNERYLGLTYWTPNINIFRDPRWGRGQETYGEDPFLTAQLGASFVRGLQGNDPKYLKAAACAKHFAVHSGPEPSRHSDNFNPTPYDLWDTYLPAFRELITKANVAGVMCAYNAIYKQPCCASDLLMNDILRNQWKFTGYVTSDCWAVDDFFRYHKTHPDATASSVDAVMHGTDVECGQTVYLTLLDAVKKGLIKEEQLDVSLKRLFTIRFRLGMFDPPELVKYAKTPFSALEAPEHQALALKMAQQSIVLLKNENNTLPLSKKLKKIAVLGPNADNRISVLGNYNGVPSRVVSLLDGIKEKLGSGVQVIYEKAVNFTNDTLLAYSDISDQYSFEGKQGFKAEYFNNRELKGEPTIVRTENKIDQFWQEGEAVAGSIRANNFSARYSTNFKADKNGSLVLEVEADDGYRFLVNDKEVINAWQRNRWGARTHRLELKKDTVYKLTLEYWQGEGKANVALRAGNYQRTDFTALANRIKDADAIIFAGGISPQLEGEEMRVDFPGFNGGDRTTILLPAVQTELMKTLRSTGKPIVFVMMTGSAIATPWESENTPAIINAWYGGQSAGTAIADVLFGDYNPAGRLPVTFYKSDADLAAFSDYSMENRTYRYFKGEALYPFGFGLSYTTFKYDQLKVPASVAKGKKIVVTARVTNTGKTNGEEVVQLYVSHQGTKAKSPLKALKGFRRIPLKAGESKTIQFELTAEQLSLVNENGNLYQPSGKVQVSVGGGQPGVKNKVTSNVTSAIVSIL